MTLATIATFYALAGLTASGVPIDWSKGNPRIIAAAADDLDAGRVHLGDRVCVTFPGGDRITYTVLDRCPDPSEVDHGGCPSGQIDILVSSPEKARRLGRVELTVTLGGCP